MRAGDYDINLPERTGDESVDQLAAALLDLSQSLDQRFQQLRTLQDVAEQVNRALLLDQVCEHVYGVFRDTIPYDRIGLALLEDGGRVLRARWARSESDTVRLPVGYAACSGSWRPGSPESSTTSRPTWPNTPTPTRRASSCRRASGPASPVR
jgi:hypothetical protein